MFQKTRLPPATQSPIRKPPLVRRGTRALGLVLHPSSATAGEFSV